MSKPPCTGSFLASSRRGFLRRVTFASGALAVAPALLRGQNLNNKLNIGIIGAGGRGGANLQAVGGENIVALCDVAEDRLEAAGAKHPKARSTSTSGNCSTRRGTLMPWS